MYRPVVTYVALVCFIAATVCPSVTFAARLDTIGVETNTTTVNNEFTFNGIGSAATDGATTTQVHAGVYSLHINETAAAAFSWMAYKYRSAASAASTTVRAYIYLNQVFGASQEIFTLADEGPGAVYSFKLNTSNQLCAYDATPTQIGSCVAITTGAWHYVEFSTNGGSTVLARLDGVQFAATTAAVGGAISRAYFGCAFVASCKSDTFYDDIAINDASGSSQTSYPGAGFDLRLSPNAAGDANTFATQTGGTAGAGNNFTRVNEITPDGASTFNGSNTLNQEDLMNVTDSGIGASDTVTLVEYHDWFRGSAATTVSSFKPEIEKTTGGTISQGTAVTPNSTTFKSNANVNPNLPPLTLYTDPDGAAWTQATLDSMQIGYKVTTGTTNRDDISTVWVYAEYIPAAVVTTTTFGPAICFIRGLFIRGAVSCR